MSHTTFKVLSVEHHSEAELLKKLRQVTMLKDPGAYPYKEADIALRKVTFQEVVPAQRYVLENELKKAQNLKWELEKHGHDLFALGGYVTITTDQADEPIDVLPPIIESAAEANGETAAIINDGMHRMYVARLEWRNPEVVFIQGVPREYPYYAYPIPGGNWNEVTILPGSEIPAGFIKKWHRISDNKLLYRDFNSAFINVGGPRGQAK
ncbi:hypothetical protein C4J81_17600 [Deltaproteobacteria bacterium Smac51]|nr:hypothetical protein C4J81_17600 [Deltaproteobacteria bacterium Smac51]